MGVSSPQGRSQCWLCRLRHQIDVDIEPFALWLELRSACCNTECDLVFIFFLTCLCLPTADLGVGTLKTINYTWNAKHVTLPDSLSTEIYYTGKSSCDLFIIIMLWHFATSILRPVVKRHAKCEYFRTCVVLILSLAYYFCQFQPSSRRDGFWALRKAHIHPRVMIFPKSFF